jgi:N-acetylglucosamine kinase-like BadF-type ATPase
MIFALGVDGGGSKTHALVLDENGYTRGFGSSGCGNHQVHGLEPAMSEIESAVQTAIEQSALTPIEIQQGCFCLAGADLKSDYQILIPAMQSLNLAQTIMVKNDTLAALRASITRPWGVVVICGSGFNAAARSPNGSEFVFPALGYISGDWGGGGRLSEEIIRLVMRAWDGRGEKTLLTRIVLKFLDSPSEEVLLERLYKEEIPYRHLLHLVPLLFQAAESGDLPSQRIIIQLGEEVAVSATTLIKRFSMQSLDVEVGLAGGIFKDRGHLLIDTVTFNIHQVAPKAIMRRTRYEPVVGAALLALENAGVTVDQALFQQLNESLPVQLKYQDLDHKVV